MYQNAHILWKKVSTRGKNGWVALSCLLRSRETARSKSFSSFLDPTVLAGRLLWWDLAY